ncbi:DUF7133 domain-containing protein [Croceivirga thetidis]|uniref:C-type cytochrome n=1 Tax=Croceivirga thetidis TaxID=2721623 RepID=A0ABX1GMS7_9FLAO|nr:c-type cytochrome [Croceivirga thetidis]NKI30370.1 c-type cytochrome [Croceivirga thetidis]
MKLRLFLISLIALTYSCKKNYVETVVDFSSYEVQEGLSLKAIAAEPLVEAPVALSFDEKGNIWVLEMPGYMRTLEGVNEEDPIGRILILQDKDGDGQADHTTVFLDSLQLGRAFAHVYGGLLYAEPPNLYFTQINDDFTPGRTVVVDSAYAVGGNVEHQPNGLLPNIDNWIYSAKDPKRYRMKNGAWLKEKTTFRGQWGITRDASGRLYYNNNSNQLRGDYSLPNLANQNPKYRPTKTVRQTIVQDQSVYPINATAVNRGYIPGMLHENGKLKNFTSACGPVYFEGVGLDENYQKNFFVCGPEVNLIKRNLVNFDGLRISGTQAYNEAEFLRSSDEAFRPVNLFNGPDGAMYIVDMHKGIIQHKTYLTSYLRNKYIEKGLDTIKGMGRILRLANNSHSYSTINLDAQTSVELVDSLSSKNIWIRDMAQRILIHRNDDSVVEKLENVIGQSSNEIAKIHAMYCLEGMGLLDLSKIFNENQIVFPEFTSHALKLMAENDYEISSALLEAFLNLKNDKVDFYFAYYLSKRFTADNSNYLITLLDDRDEKEELVEAVLSGIHPNEESFLELKESVLLTNTRSLMDSISMIELVQNEDFKIGEDGLTRGRLLYNANCATCHGPDGRGLENLAPPLLNSEFVSDKKERLVAIMLYGMHGPLTVNDKDYSFLNAMPGIGSNENLTNENIRDIGNFIRNAFTTSPQNINEQMVDSLRNIKRPFDKTFTQNELDEIFASN